MTPPHATIAAREGVTRGAITQRHLARGLTRRPLVPLWVCALVREVYDDGATLAELHEQTGVAISTLRGWIARAGGTMRPGGRRPRGGN